ncbi:hypothetical protein ONS95_012294 [Cadophora gregata]|uniref:uncharacterized protein n=1 Tax=Cadophora gregata TaxID=51156 RepID=UPI0026DC8966|nr:uncharacterized protein ONS95_012294 [Cadophora gregata]KAK0117983.1 hypothetical protein ONS95_012294 [Cadophora gregata]KAK0123049.1 hypothetical protein ONS96_010058 [Cadophora gregata f. sp. sojae]
MRDSARYRRVLTAALLCTLASAGPYVPRRDVSNAFNPWISVNPSGVPVATYTPSVATISGVETTLNPIPYSLTATGTATDSVSRSAETTAAPGGGSFQECHNRDGIYAPFCSPANGSDVNVDGKYYVTWDKDFFAQKNASVNIVANYVNDTGHGPVAFKSDPVSTSDGYYVWTIQKDWLQELKTNNVTLFLNRINLPAGAQLSLEGPTVRVKVYEKPIYHQPPSSAPNGQSLYIALPTVLGFILLCVIGGYFWNRKNRKIGLGNVMGRKSGYGTGKSRSQRMGLGKNGDIQLRDRDLTGSGQYHDSPAKVAKGLGREREFDRDSDGLGSLASSPAGNEGHNYFREELRRQEEMR